MSHLPSLSCVVTVALILPACAPSESDIKAEIEDANYCDSPDDCALAGSACPLGCNIYVNIAEQKHISKLIYDHDSDCKYKCRPVDHVECNDSKCSAILVTFP